MTHGTGDVTTQSIHPKVCAAAVNNSHAPRRALLHCVEQRGEGMGRAWGGSRDKAGGSFPLCLVLPGGGLQASGVIGPHTGIMSAPSTTRIKHGARADDCAVV